MEEIWKPIEGYEKYYEASSLGRIRSLDRYLLVGNGKRSMRLYKGKILKPHIVSNGYAHVDLRDGKKAKTILVHRTIAKTFIPNPNNLPQINHKNEIKTDNRISNLEWCTSKYNINYGEGSKKRNKTVSTAGRKSSKPVVRILSDGSRFYYNSIHEASARANIPLTSLSAILNGLRKSKDNTIWKFL